MISIVIPTLNERAYIGRLLDSIYTQTFKEDIEVVVADTNSTDGTRDVVESYRGKFTKLSIAEGGPPAIARNKGGRASSGDIIYFVDADITFPGTDFLAKNTAYFREKNLAAGSTALIPEGKRIFDHVLMWLTNVFLRAMQHIKPFGAMCIVVRRDIFEKTGGYPEDRLLSEDHDFVQTCARFGRYDILPKSIHFSVRRFDKEGRPRLLWKYAYALFYRTFVGPITKPIIEYEFAHDKKTK